MLGVIARAAETENLSRARIASSTGLTRATVGGLVDQLLVDGLVVEAGPLRGERMERGRPGNPVRLNGAGAFGVGVEINVDYVSAVAVDLTGTVVARHSIAVDNRARPPEQALADAASAAEQVSAGLPANRIAGVTLAVPGLVDASGLVRTAPNLPTWHDVAAAGHFAGAGNGRQPVQVGNEANLAALAELWFGGLPPGSDFLHVSGEIGIGAGIVMGGRLFGGSHGFAGELGHVVVDPNGASCHCGGRGCLEQVAGQEALLRDSGLDPSRHTVDDLRDQAEAGSPRARAALDAAGRALGVAVADAANLLDITTILLGGAYARIGAWLVDPIRVQLARQVTSRSWTDPQVRVSRLGADAAVLGGAGSVIAGVIADPARMIVH